MTSSEDPAFGIVIFVADSSGAVIGVNNALAQTTGLGPPQLLGGPAAAVLADDIPWGVASLITAGLDASSHTGAYIKLGGPAAREDWFLLAAVATQGTRVCVAIPSAQDRATERLESIYAAANARESDATASGTSLDKATQAGAEEIVAGLKSLGFAAYDDLLRTALPAEVAPTQPVPEPPSDSALASVWAAAVAADRQVERLQIAHAKLLDATKRLIDAAAGLLEQVEPMAEGAAQVMGAARSLSGSATPLTAAHRIQTAVEQTGIRLRALALGVERSREMVANQRLMLAIARLVDRALLDTLSRSSELGSSDLGLVVPLVGALHTLAPPLAMGTARISANLTRLAREATEAAGQVRMLDTSLTSWELLAQRFDLPSSLIPEDLDAKAAAAKLDDMRDLARGAIARTGAGASGVSEAATGLARALRYAPGFSFAL
ncbi:MAG: PAS domain-containing protein [Bifidobacteriaceae bacterium]|nr:PAS domain-containing protein [Bifidobacteriaceae bacterium]